MHLKVCDRCCKQMTRFVSDDLGLFKLSRTEEGSNAVWIRNIDLCPDCQRHIDDLLRQDFKLAFKPEATVKTGVDWR